MPIYGFINQFTRQKIFFTLRTGQKVVEPAKTGRHPSFVTVRRVHCAGWISVAAKRILPIKAVTMTFQIDKSGKLDNVCYDIRGPVLKEAKRLEEEGNKVLKLNI